MKKVPLLLLMFILASCNHITSTTPSLYSFPYEVPSEEWDQIPRSQHLQKLQMPDDFLNNASTDEILLKVLEHPILVGRTGYSDPRDAFDYMYRRINGVQEVVYRPDFVDALINLYDCLPVDSDISHYMLLANTEFMLIVTDFVRVYSEEQINRIILKHRMNIEQKRSFPDRHYWDYFSKYAYACGSRFLSHIIFDYNKEEEPYQFLVVNFPDQFPENK